MNIPITQSREWQKLQDDLGEESIFRQENHFQYLAIIKTTPAGNYLYCPYGPIAKDATAFRQALRSLRSLAKTKGAIFIRIEPIEAESIKYLPKTARKSKDLNPRETWILDLVGNNEELKAKLPSRLLRYYKSASKKGLTIETSHNPDDIHYLLDLQKALAKEKGISTFSENYLKTELAQPFATLYMVKYNDAGDTNTDERPSLASPRESLNGGKCEDRTRRGKVIAAGLVFDDKTTRYNLQGAQSDQGRRLHATGILTIQLILDAKAENLKAFDFWGIAPDDAPKNHPWAGFTAFKKTFAGHQVNHAGTYDIVLHPVKYRLYQITRQLNRLIRK